MKRIVLGLPIFLMFLILSCTTSFCFAEYDFSWKAGDGGYPGISGTVYATTTWDPDGDGPQSEVLVVGGWFLEAGGVLVHNIALWDGSTWQSLGSGLSSSVLALAVYNGELIAAGYFDKAGGIDVNHIARWNGTNWQPVGTGINGSVYAFAVYDGQLIACGDFGIKRWDGNTWQTVGGGVIGTVYALTVYNGELIVGGSFSKAGGLSIPYIARWNGSIWQKLGVTFTSSVHSLCVYNSNLIAGGFYSSSSGWPDYKTITIGWIGQWNGSNWQSLGGMSGQINILSSYNGELIAGGSFPAAISRWNGSSWQPLAGGMGTIFTNASSCVYTVATYQGELVAGGSFTIAGGIANIINIARWNTNSWLPVGNGMNGSVAALTVYDNKVVAGGSFTTASGRIVNRIACWDSNSWQSLGTGVNNTVSALTTFNGQLIAGGSFTTAGGVNAKCIARWNGSSWQSVPTYANVSVVCALAQYGNELIFGTAVSQSGPYDPTPTYYNLIRWNGSAPAQLLYISATRELGKWYPDSNPIKALAVYNGELIVAGDIATVKGIYMGGIARWNGTIWQSLGNGVNNTIRSLAVYNGELIAAGRFTMAGGIDVNHIARWNGTSWQPLGNGINDSVFAFAVYDGQLIAGGSFTTAGGKDANNIARWDGTNWQPLNGGISGPVYALAVYDGQLIAGGDFTTAGGKASAYIAEWGPDCPILAEAGIDRNVYADMNGIARVMLDGSDSNSPYAEEPEYKWSWSIDGQPYEANGVSPTIELPIGIHKIQLVVSACLANSAPDDVNIIVKKLPVAEAGSDKTVYTRIDEKAEVGLDGSDSNDANGDTLTYKWTWVMGGQSYEASVVDPVIELPVGVHTITLVVNDGVVDSLPDEVVVTVLGPVELLAQLQNELAAMNADKGVLNGLAVKVDTAFKKLADGNVKNNAAAVNALEAFINAVNAQRGEKITQGQADSLIAAAQRIIGLIN
jgi:hypothetical protein